MATCAVCKAVILFGGVIDGPRRYCNARCHQAAQFLNLADSIPEDLVAQRAAAIHAGPCPTCRGSGPVDVHSSHRCMSFILLTTRKETPILGCARCARSQVSGDTVITLLLGWWGFPFGLVFTPIALFTNIGAMAGGFKSAEPSVRLQQFARQHLAAEVEAAARAPETAAV